MTDRPTTALRARWVVPATAPTIEDGTIVFNDRIVPTDEHTGPVEDLGDAIVVPGLINAHTHLELSYFERPLRQPADLPDWLLQIIGLQNNMVSADLERLTGVALRRGSAACLAAGVTTVGDITRLNHLTRPYLATGPLRVVSFGEVLGIGDRARLVPDRVRVAADRMHDSPTLHSALSPHAPYSISSEGVRTVVEAARAAGMRLCIHLAESREEHAFLIDGGGRFAEMLGIVGVNLEGFAPPHLSPVRWAAMLNLLGPDLLVAHGNYVDAEEIGLLCSSGTSVAYCPRTHAYFQHAPHPLIELLGAGVNVCLGTDSLASNPSLDLCEELRLVHDQHPDLSFDTLIALATINGAIALGLADHVGSLDIGKCADLAVFRCTTGVAEPADAFLCGEVELVRLYIDGRPVDLG